MYLILPAAGQSSRFPNMRPKWMLTHPKGNMMLTEAIIGLNLHDMDKIYLTILREHAEQYQCIPGILQQFEALGVHNKLSIITLDHATKHQPETIAETIKQASINGPFFCKDSDSYFPHTITPENHVCTYDLNRMEHVNAANKSYVQFSEHNFISKIIEKNVISGHFCTGGYGFSSAKQYLDIYDSITTRTNLYVSDIVFQMIIQNIPVRALTVQNYLDWGTLNDWNRYKSQFSVLFVDIDGTLVKNSSEHFPPYWGTTELLSENVAVINRLHESNNVQVILTTSRNESHRDITLAQLKRCGVKYHQIVFGLFHTKRIVINDYAPSNPYKSCDAINVRRDSNDLEHKLENF
jgi:hypothetical protein